MSKQFHHLMRYKLLSLLGGHPFSIIKNELIPLTIFPSAPVLHCYNPIVHRNNEKVKDPFNFKQQESEEEHETSISFPDEIILSRLPVKPILQFRSVSKHWLSLISHDPCFPKLHFNRSVVSNYRTSFFISAHDRSTQERHFLSAPLDGGPVTHLTTLRNAPANYAGTQAEHLNGLVFFTTRNTRKVIEVPPPYTHTTCNYFFGFDESNSEHKIMNIHSSCVNPKTLEVMIFSLSTYKWRKIPVNVEEHPFVSERIGYIHQHSVCVNSVIHLMLHESYKILAFDLTTEKFSIINLPQGAIPRELETYFTRQGELTLKGNMPFLIKDNDLLGVVCHDLVVETNELDIWILQDYVNRTWVRETVTSSESWTELDGLEKSFYYHMRKVVFSCRRLSRDMVEAFVLDMKTKSFKLVNFNLGYGFLHSNSVKFHQEIKSYVECILPLREY